MPPTDDGNYSSIDPGQLGAVASSLQKSVDGVTSQISGLSTEFEENGVPVDHIDTLKRIAARIAPIIPEINRRVSLAKQLVAENPTGGKVAYFTGDLLGPFKTVAAAKACAHIDAQKVTHARDHGDSVPQSVYDDMNKYGTDPDYSSELVKEIGTNGVAFLMYKNRSEDDGTYSQPNTTIIGTVLSTASYRDNLDHTWFKNVASSLMKDGGVFNPVGMLVHQMTYGGSWSTKSVSALADITFSFGDQDGISGNRDNNDYKTMLQILSDNPVTAAQYFSGRRSDIYNRFIKRDNESGLTYGLDSQFAAFVRAATVDSKLDFDTQHLLDPNAPNIAAQNANWLVNQVGHDSYHDYSSAMDKTFADIGSAYFGDLLTTVKSPLELSKIKNVPFLGVNADVGTWKNFFAQGMKSDAGLVELIPQFRNNAQLLESEIADAGATGAHQDKDKYPQQNPLNAISWDVYAHSQLQSIFSGALKTADGQIHQDWQARRNSIDDLVSKGLDLVSDPTGALDTVAGWGEDAAKSWLSGYVTDQLVPEPKLPGSKVSVDNSSLDPDANYRIGVEQWYRAAGEHHYKDAFRPFYDGYGNKYTGEPGSYESQYGAKFTNSDGSLMPYSKIENDPKALEAYNAWLQDPAVQANTTDYGNRPG